MTHMSLFTGIGGLDIAAEWAGFVTVGQCEFADYPYRVLQKHWPDVPKWRDVHDLTAADFYTRTGLDTVTVLSGGFPCQPHSVAGKRKASADERDLWPEFRRVIGEIKPRWVVAENVPGLLSSDDGRFFRNILRDFAEMGFDVAWCSYGACDVGAPHRRERIAIVGYSKRNAEGSAHGRDSGARGGALPHISERHEVGGDIADASGELAHAMRDGHGNREHEILTAEAGEYAQRDAAGRVEDVAYADNKRSGTPGHDLDGIRQTGGEVSGFISQPLSGRQGETLAYADSQQGRLRSAGGEDAEDAWERPDSQGESGQLESCVGGMPDGLSDFLDGLGWPAGYGQQQYDWEPPRTAHGVKHRADRIKCLGNAVVPAQFYPIFKAIAELEGV